MEENKSAQNSTPRQRWNVGSSGMEKESMSVLIMRFLVDCNARKELVTLKQITLIEEQFRNREIVRVFIRDGGLECLSQQLEKGNFLKAQNVKFVGEQCVDQTLAQLCGLFRVVLNEKPGLEQAIRQPQTLFALLTALLEPGADPRVVQCCSFILTCISWLPGSFGAINTIVSLLDLYSASRRVSRFVALVALGFRLVKLQNSPFKLQTLTFLLLFIQNFVGPETNDSVSSRVLFREELAQAGFGDLFLQLTAYLRSQVQCDGSESLEELYEAQEKAAPEDPATKLAELLSEFQRQQGIDARLLETQACPAVATLALVNSSAEDLLRQVLSQLQPEDEAIRSCLRQQLENQLLIITEGSSRATELCYQGMQSFSARMLDYARRAREQPLYDLLGEDFEEWQRNSVKNATLYEVLQMEQQDPLQLLQEIELMAGCSAFELVRKNKRELLAVAPTTDLAIRSLDAPCSLRLVTADEWDALAKNKLIFQEKDMLFASLEQDYVELARLTKKLKREVEALSQAKGVPQEIKPQLHYQTIIQKLQEDLADERAKASALQRGMKADTAGTNNLPPEPTSTQIAQIPPGHFLVSEADFKHMIQPPDGFELKPIRGDAALADLKTAELQRKTMQAGIPAGFVLARRQKRIQGNPKQTGVPAGYCLTKQIMPLPDGFIFAPGGVQQYRADGSLGRIISVPAGYSLAKSTPELLALPSTICEGFALVRVNQMFPDGFEPVLAEQATEAVHGVVSCDLNSLKEPAIPGQIPSIFGAPIPGAVNPTGSHGQLVGGQGFGQIGYGGGAGPGTGTLAGIGSGSGAGTGSGAGVGQGGSGSGFPGALPQAGGGAGQPGSSQQMQLPVSDTKQAPEVPEVPAVTPLVPPTPETPAVAVQKPVLPKPKKEDINKPGCSLKSFFWDKLRDNEFRQGTVWETIGVQDIKLSEVQLQMLIAGFSPKAKEAPKETKEAPKVTAITVLDPKKSQAIAIALQRFKMPVEEIVKRILALRDLTEQDSGVDTLVACCPTQEEFNSVRAQFQTEPDIAKYAKPEQFLIKAMDIPDYGKRIKNWQFLKEFQGTLAGRKPTFQLALKFYNCLNANKRFHQFLRLMLTVGNCLNSGSARGLALGFRLKTLNKFYDSKDNTNKKTILHYVYALARQMDETVGETDQQTVQKYLKSVKEDILTETDSLWNASGPIAPAIEELVFLFKKLQRTAFEDEANQVDALQKKVEEIRESLETLQSSDPDDKYKQVFELFIEKADAQIQQTLDVKELAIQRFKDCLELFAEPSSVKMEDFAKILEEFVVALENVSADYEKEQEKIKRDAARLKRQQEQGDKPAAAKQPVKETNTMEQIMADILARRKRQ